MVIESVDNAYLKITAGNKVQSYFFQSMIDVVKDEDKIVVGVKGINSTYSLNYIVLSCDNISSPTFNDCDELYNWIVEEIGSSYFCYPKEDLLQALTSTTSTQLVDAMGKSDRDVQIGYRLDFNGTDNAIKCPEASDGDTFEYLDLTNTWQTTTLDANLEALSSYTGGIFAYKINGYECNLEQTTFYNTKDLIAIDANDNVVIHTMEGTPTNCWQTDTRKQGWLDSNLRGYGILNTQPNLIIPLKSDLTSAVTADVVYIGRVALNSVFTDGGAFKFNNTDNVINLGYRVDMNIQHFKVEFLINTKETINYRALISNSRYKTVTDGEGWWIAYLDDTLIFRYFKQSDGTLNNIIIYNSDYSNKKIKVVVDNFNIYTYENDILVNSITIEQIKYSTNTKVGIGAFWRTTYWEGPSSSVFAYVNFNDIILIPFTNKEGASNKVWDVNSDTEYTIAGVITDGVSNIPQDVYFYAQNNGATISGTEIIPASQLNDGYACDGSVLTNPYIKNHLNGTCNIKQPLAPILVNALNADNYFDNIGTATATAKHLSTQELAAIDEDNIAWNVKDEDTDVGDGLLYSRALTVEEQNQILKCYAKTNGTIDFCRDTNGDIQYDTNGEIITC